ncbi:MAG: autotransporter-associated beta strand repeat-containing protein [Opitutaceae bacterium]|jgi:autotransporter-associated beta strand protein/predicted outer membrane repeat protein|nr:autotransporter-associated beta strand repeat-containing protein [Opitutaceae bacterium]
MAILLAGLAAFAQNAPGGTHTIQPNAVITTASASQWQSGDVIMLAGPATIGGTLDLTNKPVTMQSNTPGTIRVLDSTGVSAIKANINQTLTLSDMEITRASASGNGGAVSLTGPSASVTTLINGDFRITLSSAAGNGGGLSSERGTMVFGGNVEFRDNSAGTTGGGVYSGNAVIFEQDAIFTSNTAGANGAAIYAGGTIWIKGDADISDNTAESTSATVYGGAIYAGSSLLISGTARLDGNRSTSTGRGGAAIYSNAGNILFSGDVFMSNNASPGAGGGIYLNNASGSIQIDGHLTGTNNAGLTGGGVIYSRGDSIHIKNGATLLNNFTNDASSGGAIHMNMAGKTVDISGYSVISSNTAGANGGGIYANGKVYFRDGVTMSLNVLTNSTAGNGRGGAIRAVEGVSIMGSGTFEDNRATFVGGAISVGSPVAAIASLVVSLGATGGDIVFRGNQHNLGTAGAANAIHYSLVNVTGGGLFDFNASAGNTIAFHDPISGTNDTKGFDRMRVIKTGAGTLLFDTHHSDLVATTTISTGTLRLAGGAIYGAGGGTGAFTLASAGVLAGDGAVRARDITIEAGAALEALDGGALRLESVPAPVIGADLKLAGSGTIDAGAALSAAAVRIGAGGSAATQTLTLAGALTLENGAVLRHDLGASDAAGLLVAQGGVTLGASATIALGAVASGTFTLLAWDGGPGLAASDTNKFALTVNDTALTARNRAALTIDPAAKTLTLANQVVSLGLTWAGGADALWTNTPGGAASWTDGQANAENYFHDGDSVLFDGGGADAARTVTLAADVTASQLRVIGGGTHTFTGTGSITTDAASVLAGSSVATGTGGRLIKQGAGELALRGAGANLFAGGIEHSGGVISFSSAGQIRTGPGAVIALTGGATLRAAAAIADLGGGIALAAADDTGVLDTGGHPVGYSGALSGAGTLVKTGSGALTVAHAAGAAFAGAVHVGAGSLLLAPDAVLGGSIHVSDHATAGGAGRFGGDVSIAPGGTLLVGGLASAGTLTIDGTLALHDGTLAFGHFSGGPNDTLAIAAGGTLILSGSSTIDISTPRPGTYTLGNIAQLDTPGTIVTIDGRRQIDGGRQTAAVTATTGNLLVLTYNADQSRILVWSGSAGGQWNTADSNWDNAVTGKFVNGDTVRFTGAPASGRTIAIAGGGATVSDMVVDSAGSFTFTGAGVTARADSVVLDDGVSEVTGPRGMLAKSGAGTLTLDNGANTFAGGIEIAGGALAFSRADQLGTRDGDGVDHAIAFTAGGTLRALAGGAALPNKIVIGPGAPATIDVANPAHTLTLSGTVTGATAGTGTLAKTGAGTLTYSGTAALGHAATRIDEGVVALRDIPAAAAAGLAHAFELAGANGWLDLSDSPGFDRDAPDAATANDWAALNITGAAGHVIGGNDKVTLRAGEFGFGIGDPAVESKQGLYVLIDAAGGVAVMTGSNSYAGRTLLRSGTLRATADNQLGLAGLNREVVFDGPGATLELGDGFTSTRAIELRQDGALHVAASATAAWAGAIGGAASPATLSKTGAGTLVLAGGNGAALGFAVKAGVLRGNTGAIQGDAAIDAGAALQFDLSADGAYAGIVSGAGLLEKTGMAALTLTAAQGGAFQGATHIRAGTLKAGAANVLGAASAHIVHAGAALDLGGFDQTLASLAADGSLLFDAVYNPDNGVLGGANKLTVSGALTGSGTLVVRVADDTTLATGSTSTRIIDAGAGSATGALTTVFSRPVVNGIYEMAPLIDADGNLFIQTQMISPEIPAATAIPLVSLLMGQTGLDSASQRLGELRRGGGRAGGVWARGIHREDDITGELFDNTKARTGGVQAGIDVLFPDMWADDSAFALGLLIDAFESRSRPGGAGDLDGRQYALGIYGALALGRWHAGALLRFDRSEFDVDAPGDRLNVKGAGLAMSLEAGRAIAAGAFGRVEPAAQLLYQRQNFDDNVDRHRRDYSFDAADSLQARGGIRWSRGAPAAGAARAFLPWLRVGGGYEFRGKQSLRVGLFNLENDLGGALFLAGGGATFLIGPRCGVHVSAEWMRGANAGTLSASAGMRFAW